MPRGWFNIVWRLLNSISHPAIELKEKSTLYISSLYEHCYFTLSPTTAFLNTPYLKHSSSRCHISSLKCWKHSFKPAGQVHIIWLDLFVLPPVLGSILLGHHSLFSQKLLFDSCTGYHFVQHQLMLFFPLLHCIWQWKNPTRMGLWRI